MNPFIAKPGETIKGLGYDFMPKLATGESITSAPTVTADTGLTVTGEAYLGTVALVDVAVPSNAIDAILNVYFTVTGTSGSIRKGKRIVQIVAASE